jgi:hypothetical protein
LAVDLQAPGIYDQVNLAGGGVLTSSTVVLGGSMLTLTNNSGAAFPLNTTFVIIDNNTLGSAPGDQFANGVSTIFDQLGNAYSVNYAYDAQDAGGANDVAITAVPEPAALGALAVGSLGLLARRRERES